MVRHSIQKTRNVKNTHKSKKAQLQRETAKHIKMAIGQPALKRMVVICSSHCVSLSNAEESITDILSIETHRQRCGQWKMKI